MSAEPHVGLIAGDIQDLPVRAGMAPAFPNLGIVAPPPNYILEQTRNPSGDPGVIIRSRRYGVTHGIYEGERPARGCEIVYVGTDATLDALLPSKAETKFPRTWRVERYADVFPEVRCALRVVVNSEWSQMYPLLSRNQDLEEVYYLDKDLPTDPPGPRARFRAWYGGTVARVSLSITERSTS